MSSDRESKSTPTPFIAGSSDFFNFVEPKIDEVAINDLFMSYQQFLEGTKTEAELESGAGEPVDTLLTFKDKFSYGYGYAIQYNIQSQGIIVDLENFHAGVADAFAEIPLPYAETEIDQLFAAFESKLLSEYEAMIGEMSSRNLAEAEDFLAENAAAEGVVTTESGLQYKVMSEGTGAFPVETDTVKVDYLITFLDGSTGDNSYSRGDPSVFALGNLIPGFSEGVKLMPGGSHYRFYVHPSLAYGETGNESIPPNTLLIFDVELHEIVK
jgi:FKBP-type peptidyl-prolyl cis-trans isomerase